ncbi:MAG: efflux RND transporter periplasmic adaptor subunit [Deltaproteobacteria bacterium]|nr:efflux RND transporter periplasmic adaptor subunit [Deltaproteobacteria bacterium]
MVLGLLAVSGLNLFFLWHGENQAPVAPEEVPVRVAAVSSREFPVVLEQSAEVKPANQVLLIPKIKGQEIREILVERGDRVTRGQVLARLDPATIAAQLAQLTAALAQARASRESAAANLEVLVKDLARIRRLAHTRAVPPQQLEHTEAQHRAAVAAVDLAAARVQEAQAALLAARIVEADHVLLAPLTGFVSRRFQDPGSLSSDKDPMFQITQENPVKIISTVGERDYPRVRPGLRVEVQVDAYPGRVFPARVSAVSPCLEAATRSAELEIMVDNPDLALRSGMYAHTRLSLGSRTGLAVPRGAVERLPGTGVWYVFVVEKGRARQVNVRPGDTQGPWREVLEGLTPGQMVVERGLGRLQEGASVKVEPAATPRAPEEG